MMASFNLEKTLKTAKGRGNELAAILLDSVHQYDGKMLNFKDFLPFLFHFDGKPVTLQKHFCMEPLFDADLPREVTLMCARQVGKSMQLTLKCLLNASWTPNWNILVVAPFFETIRRLSTYYFLGLMEQSPSRGVFMGRGCMSQVLERTLPNRSRIRFTYAYRSADRARGITAQENIWDEYQLMLPEVAPVLLATMDASEYGDYVMKAGTPLTNSNILSKSYHNSSQSHWMIKCKSCRKENIAALEYDLLNMIGPVHENISFDRPGIICAKCHYPLFPWDGRFVHLNPAARFEHLGLHVPSIVLPSHCCYLAKWQDLWGFMNGDDPDFVKFNEALGVPYDDGVALLTENDMRRTATLGPNHLGSILPRLREYQDIVLGVDWGGGGLSGESLTKVAVCGLNSDGRIHVLFGMKFGSTASTQEEANVIHMIWKVTKARYIAHDNLGIGSKCEAMLVEKGIPVPTLVPMEYAGETQGQICRSRKSTPERPRPAISIDKTRGMLHMIEAFHSGQILTFKMEDRYHAKDLLMDLTHLRAEERVPVAGVKNATVLIQKEAGQSDDFAHAVHLAANWLWLSHNAWPRLSKKIVVETPQDLANYMVELKRHLDPETIDSLFGELAS